MNNCCTCNGWCMHIGPHSYCYAHGGGGLRLNPPIYPTTVNGLTSLPKCVHCYCKPKDVDGIPHKVCCNCGNKQEVTDNVDSQSGSAKTEPKSKLGLLAHKGTADGDKPE